MFSFVSGAVKSGINAINRIHGMSGILKAFSKVSGQILDAAGLNFGKDLRDMNVSPYHLFELRKGMAKNEIYVLGYR